MNKYPTYKLGEICKISTGKWDANHATPNGRYRFYTCANVYSKCDTASYNGKCVIVPGNGDLGLLFYYDGEFDAYQRTYVLSEIKIDAKFLYYHMMYKWRSSTEKLNYGSTIKYVRITNFTSYEIEVPDKTTQHQIVSRIESLFAELDKAVEHLRTAQQQLKTYRQAVLNHWLNNEDEKWETVKLGEVAEKIQIGPFGTQLHKSDYIDGGTPLINPMHIYNKKILPDYSFSVSDEKYKELTNYYLEKDDVILGRRGEMGRCAVVSEKEDGMLCGTGSLFIRGGKLLDATYLCHLLSSQKLVSYFENSSSGTTMSNLNQGIIKNCEIPFPPLPEQQHIVKEIETHLSQAEAAEARIAEALQKTESLRQSILKKAFSGELV